MALGALGALELIALGVGVLIFGVSLAALLITSHRAKRVENTLEAIHVLVNSRLHLVLERVEQLTDLLKFHHIPVPPEDDRRRVMGHESVGDEVADD